MGAVVDPFAGCGDPLAGGDDSRVADYGHQIAMAARFRPENTKAVLAVVEGDPLHKAGEYFLSRWFKIGLHTVWKPRVKGPGVMPWTCYQATLGPIRL